LILGVLRESNFGPLLMFGLGGILVEVLQDVVFRIAPITRLDARDMLHGIRGHRLLQGVRGQGPADQAALEDTLLRVSQLAMDLPEVGEVDINPLLASTEGALAVDARVLISDASQGRPQGA
jgi:acyl-CoA synthetase (NDP forming)